MSDTTDADVNRAYAARPERRTEHHYAVYGPDDRQHVGPMSKARAEAAAAELAEGYSVGRVRPDPHWIQRGGVSE